MNPLRWFLNLFPAEQNNSAGWGPFRLPSPECDWMQRAAELHDWSFEHAKDDGKRLSEIDALLFHRWVLEAESVKDPIQRCKRYGHIAKYWPYARAVGRFLWDGESKPTDP